MDSSAGPDRVEKQGYLVKKGHIRHSWRTRWFVLKKNSLEYFKTRQDTRPKGRISLVGASLNCPNPDPNSLRPWMLILTTVEGKEYLIQAPDRGLRDEWKVALEEKIRRLDPSKRGLKKAVTLSRSLLIEEADSEMNDDLAKQREIVSAMQDCSAGVKLRELRRGRLGRHVDRYFTGKDAVDWLITWFFVSTQLEAVSLANSMLRNGLFHAIISEEEGGKNSLTKSTIAADKATCNEFLDSDMARYIFVSYVTAQCVEKLLFSDSDSEDTSSSSPEPFSNLCSQRLQPQASEDSDSLSDIGSQDRIIRQGYLLKQGHLRKNWKTRRFVLRDAYLDYYKIEKVKTKPQGTIPLLGSKLSILDEDSIIPISPTRPKRHSLPARLRTQTNGSGNTTSKSHMFYVETSRNTKYIIQAESDEERLLWMSDIAKQIEEVTKADVSNRTSPLI